MSNPFDLYLWMHNSLYSLSGLVFQVNVLTLLVFLLAKSERDEKRALMRQEKAIRSQQLLKERDVVLSTPYQVNPSLYLELFPSIVSRPYISHKKPREGTFIICSHLIEPTMIWTYNDNQYMADERIDFLVSGTYIHQLCRFPSLGNQLGFLDKSGKPVLLYSLSQDSVHYLSDSQTNIFLEHLVPKKPILPSSLL